MKKAILWMAFVTDTIHKFLLYWDIVKDNSCAVSLCLTCYLPSKPPFLSGTLLIFCFILLCRVYASDTEYQNIRVSISLDMEGNYQRQHWKYQIGDSGVELIPVFNISGRRMKVGKLNKTKFIILKKNKNRYNYKDDFGISYCKLCFHAHKWTHE